MSFTCVRACLVIALLATTTCKSPNRSRTAAGFGRTCKAPSAGSIPRKRFSSRTEVVNFTLDGGLSKRANFLGRGQNGFAYITEDNRVLKVPETAPECMREFRSEAKLFTETVHAMAAEPNDAKVFAGYLVQGNQVEVTIQDQVERSGSALGGYRGPALLKDLAQGVSLSEYVADSPAAKQELSDALDRLYAVYKEAYKQGYAINDLNDGNVIWDPAKKTLAIIDAGDITGTGDFEDFKTLCAPNDWSNDRAVLDPESRELTEPGSSKTRAGATSTGSSASTATAGSADDGSSSDTSAEEQSKAKSGASAPAGSRPR